MFRGRYGFDLLNKVLLLIGLLLTLSKYTFALGFVMIIYSLYRALSKDTVKRSNEGMKFENWLRAKLSFLANKGFNNSPQGYGSNYRNMNFRESINSYTDSIKKWVRDKKKYKIVSCTKCGQKLRLPRGKGKIIVTCKKCGFEFKMKS